jgi:hypothetical protein
MIAQVGNSGTQPLWHAAALARSRSGTQPLWHAAAPARSRIPKPTIAVLSQQNDDLKLMPGVTALCAGEACFLAQLVVERASRAGESRHRCPLVATLTNQTPHYPHKNMFNPRRRYGRHDGTGE